MKKLLTSVLFLFCSIQLFAQTVADFENVNLPSNGVLNGSGGPFYSTFNSGGFVFPNQYQTAFGGYWSGGWAYSNIQNDTSAGFQNLYASYANSGFNSSNYVVGQSGATIRLQSQQTIMAAYVTNTTYAALSMKNGDMFAKKFGGTTGNDSDFFILTIKAWRGETLLSDSVNFYLADYRNADNAQDYIVKNWTPVNLSSFGMVDSLLFELHSSDVGQFGMNTPGFFCLDQMITVNDTASFENLNLGVNKFWNKGSGTLRQTFTSGNIQLNTAYTISNWGDYWSSGFAVSALTDYTKDSVSAVAQMYKSIAGGGADSTQNYAIGKSGSGLKLLNAAAGKQVAGMYVTNSNYAYLSMKYGDAFARKFNDTDYFKLMVYGYLNGTQKDSLVQVNLAANGNILDTWQWCDLTSLGDVDSIIFSLKSSDVGQFGMNTPAFFCFDQFTTRDFKTGLTEVKYNTMYSVYPNPTVQGIHIHALIVPAAVEVFDAAGRLMKKVFEADYIDLSDLQNGLYYIRIQSEEKFEVHKIIKQ